MRRCAGFGGGIVNPDLPDCPWCDSANTLKVDWSEMGTDFCRCSCCSKRCRVDNKGRVHKVESRKSDYISEAMFNA